MRIKERTETEEHPLKTKGEETETKPKNDLEGVKIEMKKLHEEMNKAEERTKVQKHPYNCGCEKCLWQEVRKGGKITSKRVNEIITEFMKNRVATQKMYEETHEDECLCIIHLRKKSKEKEKVISTILNELKDTSVNKKKSNKPNQ